MTNINFEIFLGNVSFVTLFFIMILYWVQLIFSIIPKFDIVIFFTTICVNLALLTLLVFRWINYGHFPLSNLYESLIFLSWSFSGVQLIFLALLKNNIQFSSSETQPKGEANLPSAKAPLFLQQENVLENVNFVQKETFSNININVIIGSILAPIALFTNSFANFSLPKTMQQAHALVPALQSNWLMMHVSVMMLSYAALLGGSLLSITFLIITWHPQQNNFLNEFFSSNFQSNKNIHVTISKTNLQLISQTEANLILNNPIPVSTKKQINQEKHLNNKFEPCKSENFIQNLNVSEISNNNSEISLLNKQVPINVLANTLDNLSYRILGIGFPLLTIGILSGAVWANEAWGSYWSWDPKETWAFITWLIFAIYLHTRITKGWEGKKPAILASFGFIIVWICYLGVNLLGTGLHSYGWIK